MTCNYPLSGYKSRQMNPSGKRNIVFNLSQGLKDFPVTVPCGQCTGCRLERSRQWAIRCMHESSQWDRNCFITLTYAPEHLPENGTLVKRDYQLFMKKLRKRFGPNIRYYMCGEYGEKNARPHYHACLFNFDFRDKELWKNIRGNKLYTSKALTELWPQGFSSIGDVTFESAAYVARYITKKITGAPALDHYTSYDRLSGEIYSERLPEYTNMSLKPGIGATWFEQYQTDVYPKDEVIIREKPVKPPRFYDKLMDKIDPLLFRKVKGKRTRLAKTDNPNHSLQRLHVRELVKVQKTKTLKRSYESNET
jgi:hypothetical protein